MLYHIYCDESRQSKDRYMVLGGIIIPANNVAEFNQTMFKFRIEQNMKAELKWTKVSNQKLLQYKRFMEYFFALNNTDKLHFRSIIIDNHQVDHQRFSKGDKELGSTNFIINYCYIALVKAIVRIPMIDLSFTWIIVQQPILLTP